MNRPETYTVLQKLTLTSTLPQILILALVIGSRGKCALSDRQKQLIQLIRPVTHAQEYATY